MDLLRQGTAWLTSMQRGFASSPILYRKVGFADLVGLLAEYGRTDDDITSQDGIQIHVESWDFRFAAADFLPFFGVVDGQQVMPQAADRILDGTSIYEVTTVKPLGAWRWDDPYQSRLLVHTRIVAA